MEILRAKYSDIDEIMQIIVLNQRWFKENHIDQWQDGYPNSEVLRRDIDAHGAYKAVINNEIIGYFYLSFDGEETYRNIYDGSWSSDDKYAVIHRICLKPSYKGQGLSKEVMRSIEKMVLDHGYNTIRIDTHQDNFVMGSLLEKLNYHKCGIIYLKSKAQRIAYDKILKGVY